MIEFMLYAGYFVFIGVLLWLLKQERNKTIVFQLSYRGKSVLEQFELFYEELDNEKQLAIVKWLEMRAADHARKAGKKPTAVK